MKAVAAVDLGATSGRVMLGYVAHNDLRLVPVARFPNGPVAVGDELHWDLAALYDHVLTGLASAARAEPAIVSLAVDSWAVDYGLLASGQLRQQPFHYRDGRTASGVALVREKISSEALYAATGVQFLPFNSVYQLAADQAAGRLDGVDRFLLIPDLISYWLTGIQQSERTNASTTGLLDLSTGEWSWPLIDQLGLPRGIFAPLVDAGAAVGGLLPAAAARVGLVLEVSTVGSHDTASAVVAVPATNEDFAYISSGTWSLVGVELPSPVLTEASRLSNFTNEGGVDGRVRFLRNAMGLWMLNESIRTWEAKGETIVLADLLAAAENYTGPITLFDPDDPRFLPPGDMPDRVGAWLAERGHAAPTSRAGLVRTMLESLAEAYAAAVRDAVELSGKRVSVVHMLGGGSQNALLCQLTANRIGLPVLAGPAEATAIGNVLVQARARGIVDGSLEALRAIVAASHNPRRFLPR